MTQAREQVRAHLDELSVTSRRHRGLLRRLREPATIADLVDATALSRRAVETLLRLAGPDLEQIGDTYALAADGYDELALPDGAPLAWTGREDPALVDRLIPLIAAAPPPVKHFDHVPATRASVARRATWLADELWLPGATIAFVGDHDLTSVALALAVPDVRIVVVDLDARLLDHLREVLPDAELHHLDLRDPLPTHLVGTADAFVTDPPYTPTGAALFVARGLAMLRGGSAGAVHRRGLLAYGYGEELPTLGLKVQRAVQDLDVVFEQVLPRFGRYVGAQAVGSASDWYVLAPTPRTARAVARFTVPDERIYTHGRQSQEAVPAGSEPQGGVANSPAVNGPVSDDASPDRLGAGGPHLPADPADVLRARLAEHAASTVRAAAVTALA
ncbi:MAG: bis-aminopropyl spermidine synthase family protein, partial [Actinobacteria bacterium]|nr:bis-aminopropyl spermidine synthase family protein [Actinomycetota bacterium]